MFVGGDLWNYAYLFAFDRREAHQTKLDSAEMIKKIPVAQLRIGMYVHDLNCSWINHPFVFNQFIIDKTALLDKILEAGVKEVFIDTSLGVEEGDAETNTEAGGEIMKIEAPPPEPSAFLTDVVSRLSPAEELIRAKELYSNANKLMHDMMKDVRIGKQVKLEQCEPMVDKIIDSMFRMPSALLPLAQIKTADEYTFQHSVSVSALTVAFGRVLELPLHEIKELAMGGLLHDVGKAKVPGFILNKPGKLEEAEFVVMKSHAFHTADLLKKTQGVSEIVYNAAAQHHERYDGSGYPDGLKGEGISFHGQMLAIVDVYDAITSIRVYHKGMAPAEALRKLFSWSDTHFNPTLVRAFIKGIGIYPAGSLVCMESERLGIVREIVPDKLLQPIVQLIYDCKKRRYIPPEMVDVSISNDKIKSHETFEKWGIDQSKWVAAPA